MDFTVQDIGGLSGSFREVRELMMRSFPPQEQMPFRLLRLMALREGISFRVYYAGGALAGLAYTIETNRTMFLLFLAVHESIRGTGCGSAILRDLKKRAGRKRIVLNIEPLADDVPDAAERRSRLEFYLYTGFTDSGWVVRDKNDTYHILTSGVRPADGFDEEDYIRAVGRLTFGMYRPVVFRDE